MGLHQELGNVIRRRLSFAATELERQGYHTSLHVCCRSCAAQQFGEESSFYCYDSDHENLDDTGAIAVFYTGGKPRTVVKALRRVGLDVLFKEKDYFGVTLLD